MCNRWVESWVCWSCSLWVESETSGWDGLDSCIQRTFSDSSCVLSSSLFLPPPHLLLPSQLPSTSLLPLPPLPLLLSLFLLSLFLLSLFFLSLSSSPSSSSPSSSSPSSSSPSSSSPSP